MQKADGRSRSPRRRLAAILTWPSEEGPTDQTLKLAHRGEQRCPHTNHVRAVIKRLRTGTSSGTGPRGHRSRRLSLPAMRRGHAVPRHQDPHLRRTPSVDVRRKCRESPYTSMNGTTGPDSTGSRTNWQTNSPQYVTPRYGSLGEWRAWDFRYGT